MKPGYKQTEVGVIPEDWGVASLESFAKVTSGKRLPLGYFVGDIVTPYPYIRVTDMRPGWVDARDVKYVPIEAYPPISKYRIYKEDLFISVAGTLGIVGKIPDELDGANLTENANRVSSIACDRDYLLHVMMSPIVQGVIESEQTVGAQPKLALVRIRNFSIPLPPTKEEQSAIATALSDMDALLAGLDKLIAKKRDLKQATMQQLLTGKTRLPGFAEEWEVKRLGDVLTIRHGKNQAGISSPNGEYPILATGGQIGTATHWLYNKPSVLIGRKGTIDQPQYMETPFWTVDTLFYSELKDGNSAKFFYYRFCLIDWMQHNEASGVPSLNARTIEAIEVACPIPKEQTAIAEVLSDMDTELAALEQCRKKTRLLKRGMMQELLTGKTRLMASAVASPGVTAQVIDFPSISEKPGGKPIQRESNAGGKKANVHFIRSVLAAEIIDRLHDEPTFGHVKCEKVIYLADRLCKVDTGSHYHRDAAGPYDNRALRSIDSQLKRQQWFDLQKYGRQYRYVPMNKRGGHREYFDRYFGQARPIFDQIIDTFRSATWEQCEIVTTLFEAWHDLLERQLPVPDDAIVHEVLNNWHESKQRIGEDRWRRALDWMREKGFVPDGAEPAC